MKSAVAIITLAGFLGVGCIGPFTLSHGLAGMNAKAGNKWTAELVFLGLVLVHAYLITSMIDLLILNPVYFWQAPNTGPAFSDEKKAELDLGGGRRAVLTYSDRDRALRADVFERGRWIDFLLVTRQRDGVLSAENSNGRIRYESRPWQDGIRRITNESGAMVFAYRTDGDRIEGAPPPDPVSAGRSDMLARLAFQ
ncbi:MAG TPA: DUF3332 family protein [Nitrospiria bacterium]|nr:DUF3332 family protein [Nitrospiria bacterium]